jgi:predicted dinucleotide-binding enzyme
MEIGIIGAGYIGSVLAQHLTKLGHNVVIANSRGPETLQKLAADTGAKPVHVEEAAAAQDIVIVTIPEKAVTSLPANLLSGSKAIVVDTGNYYPTRDIKIEEIENGLPESQWVEKMIGHPVIKAFNNIMSASLESKGSAAGSANRVALSVAGDDDSQKQTVMALIDQIGFVAIDGGTLAESWRQQPGTPAYCHDLDKEALKNALQQADASQQAAYRAKADEDARAFFV